MQAHPTPHDELQDLRRALAPALPLANYTPHPRQHAFHAATAPVRAFIAANRAGKTTAGAAEALRFALGLPTAAPRTTPTHGWIVTLDFHTPHDVARDAITRFAPPNSLYEKTERRLTLPNGSSLTFKSCDSGRDKFQGAALDWIWIDEEPPEDIFRECRARLIDKHGYLWLTMTPLKGLTWAHRAFIAQPEPGSATIGATMADNPALDPAAIQAFAAALPPHERDARLLGLFTPLAANPYFDSRDLIALNATSRPPIFTGEVAFLESQDSHPPRQDSHPNPETGHVQKAKIPVLRADARGRLAIWEMPIKGELYTLGVDPADGNPSAAPGAHPTGDPTALHVTRVRDLHTVARWHGHISAFDLPTSVIAPLAAYYNDAHTLVEINGLGLGVQNAIDRPLPGGSLPVKNVIAATGEAHSPTTRGGFRTTQNSRRELLRLLHDYVRDRLPMPCAATSGEFTTFVHPSDGRPRPEASPGTHDDLLFAKALSLYAAHVLRDRAPRATVPQPAAPWPHIYAQITPREEF